MVVREGVFPAKRTTRKRAIADARRFAKDSPGVEWSVITDYHGPGTGQKVFSSKFYAKP